MKNSRFFSTVFFQFFKLQLSQKAMFNLKVLGLQFPVFAMMKLNKNAAVDSAPNIYTPEN